MNGDTGVVKYAGLGGEQARQLLGRMTPRQLAESQAAGPSLGSVLGAAARNLGRVEFIGYMVGPHRTGERLSAIEVLIYDDELQTGEQVLEAAQRYGVGDAPFPPDAVTLEENAWRPGEKAWRLWGD